MLKHALRIAALLAQCALPYTAHASTTGTQEEETDFVALMFPGCTPTRCIIKWNTGGRMPFFEFALAQMQQRHIRHIMVDGVCVSACVHVLDQAQLRGIRVCLTPIAVLGFHKGSIFAKDRFGNAKLHDDGTMMTARYFNPTHSAAITRWVKRHGGYPIAKTFDSSLKMRAEDAVGIFPLCSAQDLR